MATPRLIMGVGNYTHPRCRHSVGIMVLERLAARYGVANSWVARRDCKGQGGH